MTYPKILTAIGAAAFLAASASPAFADGHAKFDAITGTYTDEETHRYITFSYSHQGYSNPIIRWDDWSAVLEWNAEDPEKSSIDVTIDVASVNSGVEEFNGHLKGDGFFDVANYPEITFKSTKVERTGDNTGKITGDLTIKDQTKPVVLDVVFNKAGHDERNSLYKIGFSAKTQVLRSDFGVDRFVPFVGDEVDIVIEAEFVKPE